jgi:catechol 2,3-dioxygenase-like lactoylglutathione lyase family enzyme
MSVTDLDHVLVLAEDIEQTRDFYRDVVGLRVGYRPGLEFPGYWLYAGATPRLHIADRRAYRDHAATVGLAVDGSPSTGGPVDHVAFAAAGLTELRERVQRNGLRAVENQVPGGPRQLFVEDPNGVRVELNFAG